MKATARLSAMESESCMRQSDVEKDESQRATSRPA